MFLENKTWKWKMKKVAIYLVSLCFSSILFAFDWPQGETQADSFYSYFGQLRGSTISSSLIFSDSSDIKSCEDGKVLAVITEHTDDFGWFESPLGNAVILAHSDNISSVYGNIDESSISEELLSSTEIKKGTYLGTSANSGWQEGNSCLEFQLLDTKNSNAINPRILMPRIGKELELFIRNVILIDKKGNSYSLNNKRNIPAGTYYIYRERQNVAVPYRTSISVNGIAYENISYDTLNARNGKLCAHGNEDYPLEILYPDREKQLLGQVSLTRGKLSLSIAVINILGAVEQVNFAIDVQ